MFTGNSTQSTMQLPHYIDTPSSIEALEKPKNILIVDSDVNVLNRLAYSFALCTKEYTIFPVTTGWEAVEILQSYPIGIVLTDLDISIASGYSLIEYVRSHHSFTRIYAMSDNPPFAINGRMRHLGISGHISKPLSMEMIYSVLRI
jgi:two-component system response regulator YesN